MFTRLTVKNFRSIGEVSIELAPYTVIVGQNQAGKSNTLRAMRALFTNATGDDFIRQGQTSCLVEIETDDGYKVRWEKTKTSATYTIIQEGKEDRTFTKLAGQVPPEVSAALGIRCVEVDATTNIWPQVHQQGEFAFLIKPHLTAGQAARAIARLTKLDVVVKAQQLCKSAIRNLTAEAKEQHNAWLRSSREMEEFQFLEQEKSFLDDAQAVRRGLGEDISRYVDGKVAVSDYLDAAEASELFVPHPDDMNTVEESLNTLDGVIHLLAVIDAPVLHKVPGVDVLRAEVAKLAAGLEAHDCLCESEETLGNLNVASAVMFGEQKEIEQELAKFKGTQCPVCGGTL